MATRSHWGDSLTQKIKAPKPKNIGQAAANKATAIEAITNNVCLSMVYHGHPRIVEVHTVGIAATFKPAMSAFQVDGGSNTPPIPDWREFYFDECFNVSLTDAPSKAPRPGYKRGAKQFRSIEKEI